MPGDLYLSDFGAKNYVMDYNLYYDQGRVSNDMNFSIINLVQTSWDTYHENHGLHSIYNDPFFVSNSNFYLQPTSPAIDAGTDVGLTTDYAGNPIYGLPDIGAYEYQPIHTMVASEDNPQIGEAIRVYGDGKFRNTADDSNANTTDTAKLSIVPQSSATTKWIDLNVSKWNTSGDYAKTWTENGDNLDHATNTLHTIGDLSPNTAYTIKIDGTQASSSITGTNCTNGICTSDNTGNITFTYTRGYSTHTFDISDTTAPIFSNITPSEGSTVSSDDTITFTDSETTNPQCSLDNSHWNTCVTLNTNFNNLTSWDDINEKDSFTLYLKDTDSSGNLGTAQINNLIKADESAPIRNEGSPSGELSFNTTATTLSLVTNESATCRYATTAGTAYTDMTNNFTTTNNTHTKDISNLSDGSSYSYYVRCQDEVNNTNDTDYLISFSVASKDERNDDEDNEEDNNRDLNIHNVKAESTTNSITLNWKTDYSTRDEVRYGADRNLKEKKKDKQKEKKHTLTIDNLIPNTTYYFRIKSEDKNDNEDRSKIHEIRTQPAEAQKEETQPNNSETSEPAISTNENLNANTCAYTVKEGDTLWNISQQVYGNGANYQKIIELNKDKYSNIETTLNIGEELNLCDNDSKSEEVKTKNVDKNNQEVKNNSAPNNISKTQESISTSNNSNENNFVWWKPWTWF